MQFEEYQIVSITQELPDVYTIQVTSKLIKKLPQFTPGQFYHIKNPTYSILNVTRPLSAITTFHQENCIEFCIKVYGDWSKALVEKKTGESLWLFGPMGVFTIHNDMKNVVFIIAGIGITPVISMISSLYNNNASQSVTLFYANKSPYTIVKEKLIRNIFAKRNNWKFIPVISGEEYEKTWDGYQGRITKELLEKEVDLKKNNTFFICGSPVFTKHIIEFLRLLGVGEKKIKQEVFLGHVY